MVFWNILKIATFARFMFYLYIFLGCKFSINGNQQSQLKNKHLNVFFFFNWQHWFKRKRWLSCSRSRLLNNVVVHVCIRLMYLYTMYVYSLYIVVLLLWNSRLDIIPKIKMWKKKTYRGNIFSHLGMSKHDLLITV